ncbi:MAG: hypothetical protein MZV70_30815 [Desulfobacterales bacterium]|nr:hypothetical protein [Desulfobacterales bacterium]
MMRLRSRSIASAAGDLQMWLQSRHPADLEGCHALALPGGESTTISRLIDKNHLYEPIRNFSGWYFCNLRRHGADGNPRG